MEKLNLKGSRVMLAAAISSAAFSGCSIDSYNTDPSSVQCDGERTKVDLEGDGLATFNVRGNEDRIATVTVKRESNLASVKTEGDTEGSPPQQLAADGFSVPVKIADGYELSAFGAGGAWVIDVRNDSVVIQGSCDEM